MLKKGFKKAFTLVELVIVLAVIAVLAIFVVPNFADVLGASQATAVKNDTKVVSDSVHAFVNETGVVPVANTDATKLAAGGTTIQAFKVNAAAGKYYVLDMGLLTAEYTSILDQTVIPNVLKNVPTTSAVKDVSAAGAMSKSNNVKKTSVLYVVDKNLNVYAMSATKMTDATAGIDTKTGLVAANDPKLLDMTNQMTGGTLSNVFKVNLVDITTETDVTAGIAAPDSI